jgi:MFS family permease
MGWWGGVCGVQGAVAPFLAESFALTDAEIARALGWIGCSALGALALGRLVDRIGRRRVLLACLAGLPAGALATAAAPTMEAYVAFQVAVYALGTTLLSTVSVALAESLRADRRARGHGHAGAAFTAAMALPLALAAGLATVHGSWRWVWAAAALPGLLWPWLRRGLAESAAWRDAAASGRVARTPLAGVFRAGLGARTARVLLAMACLHAAETALRTWLFYHAVRELGLAPGVALGVLVAGGLASFAGFRLGGDLADRLGRRIAFAVGAVLAAVGAWGYYGSSTPMGVGFLATSFAALAVGGSTASVAFRALATELFPAPLRGRLGGWLAVASAAGFVVAMQGVAALSGPLGSLGAAVLVVALVAMPAATVLVAGLPETARAPSTEPHALAS